MIPEDDTLGFDVDLIKKYPRSNRRLVVDIDQYGRLISYSTLGIF